MRACAILLCTLLAPTGMIGPAIAQSSALVGDNYESFTEDKTCMATGFCTVSFAAAPLMIHVSQVVCRVLSTNPIYTLEFGPSNSSLGSLNKYTFFERIDTSASASFTYGHYKSTPNFHVGGGKFPTVRVYGVNLGTISVRCSLSGKSVQ